MNALPPRDEETDVALEDGPGHRLRAARESKNLSFTQVAEELHLGEDVIAAIEREDYGSLPGSVFVQGYLRKYARLLGESEELIVQAYHKVAGTSVGFTPAAGAPLEQKAASSWGGGQVVAILLLIAALVLGVLWWKGDFQLPELAGQVDKMEPSSEPSSQPVTDLPLSEVIDQPEESPVEAPVEQPEVSPEMEPLVETAPEEVVAIEPEPEPELEPTESAMAAEAAPIEESAAELTADEQPIGEEIESPPTEAVSEVEVVSTEEVEAQPAVVIDTSVGIVFEFSEKCWVEVRDASGKYAMVGNMEEGTQRVLTGEPPFKVTLGNSEAVKLTIDGKPFDLAPHTSANVARFTLDAEQLM